MVDNREMRSESAVSELEGQRNGFLSTSEVVRNEKKDLVKTVNLKTRQHSEDEMFEEKKKIKKIWKRKEVKKNVEKKVRNKEDKRVEVRAPPPPPPPPPPRAPAPARGRRRWELQVTEVEYHQRIATTNNYNKNN